MNSHGQERILFIRFHAIGDTAITLRACQALRDLSPEAQIDFITMAASEPMLRAVECFDTVRVFPDSPTRRSRIRNLPGAVRKLRKERYSIVIDLQANWVSRTLRLLIRPPRWAEFDRVSSLAAGTRVLRTFHRAGFLSINNPAPVRISRDALSAGRSALTQAGWDGSTPLVLLNPAGLWRSRNWPDDYFARVASVFHRSWKWNVVYVGTSRIAKRVRSIQEKTGSEGIDLIGRTTLDTVMGILPHLSLAVSEDSGLMHMAAATGLPTIALMGSTRHDRGCPDVEGTRCFHSGDLPCGGCMSPDCRYHDVHCLTRVTPESVIRAGEELLHPSRRSEG